MDAFIVLERLRKEAGRRAIVGIGIAHPVRVELDLAIVEVEVGRVREVGVGMRIFAYIHL